MPQNICIQCIADVQNAFAYKLKCEKSDAKLREYLRIKESLSSLVLNPSSSYQLIIKNEETESIPCVVHNHIPVEAIVVDPLNQWVDTDNVYEIANINDQRIEAEFIDVPLDETQPSELVVENIDVSEANASTAKNQTGKSLKKCPVCDRGFTKQNHLNRHLGTHAKKEYPCAYCSEVFVAYHTRRIHIAEVHESGTKGRKNHEQIIFNETPVCFQNTPNGVKKCICKICGEVVDCIAALKSHLKWHADCSESLNDVSWEAKKQYIFNDETLTDQILTKEHFCEALKSQLQLPNGLCKLYQITNEQGWELSMSASETEGEEADGLIKKESNKHTCKICLKSFDRTYKIMAHIRDEHVPETEFGHLRCPQCQQLFPNEELLVKHQHGQCLNDHKKFVCGICNCHFMWESSLAHHFKIRHPSALIAPSPPPVTETVSTVDQPREKTFVCDLCTKSFYRQEHLERHRKIHIPEEKKFSCDLCKKCFNRKDNLKCVVENLPRKMV